MIIKIFLWELNTPLFPRKIPIRPPERPAAKPVIDPPPTTPATTIATRPIVNPADRVSPPPTATTGTTQGGHPKSTREIARLSEVKESCRRGQGSQPISSIRDVPLTTGKDGLEDKI